jgi:hypothetical protein
VFPIGTTTVTGIGCDAAGNLATNSFTVTVEDTESPVLRLPANLSVVAGPGQSNAVITYVAAASDNSGSAPVVCVPPSGTAFPVGVTTVTCTATDDSGNTASGSFTVTVIGEAPEGQGYLITSRPVLWPANRKMIPVGMRLKFDAKKARFTEARIVSVTSNEPETGLDAQDVGPDWEVPHPHRLRLKLRAERDPNGAGRVYTISVEAKDAQGNFHLFRTTATAPVEKPTRRR